MNKPLAKIGRQNHLNHLVAIMPLLTIVYCVQCFIMHKFAPQMDIGEYAINLGVLLSAFIGMMVYYDNNHNVLIYKDHLHIHFGILGTDIKVNLQDIEEIIAPEKEMPFSSLMIKTKDKKRYMFYFVDFPLQVKTIIESQKDDKVQTQSNEDKDSYQDAA